MEKPDKSEPVAICYDGYNQSAHTGASMTLRSAMTGHDGNDADPKIAAVFKIRAGRETYTKPDGKPGTAGKGLLMSDEAAFTVSVAQDQQLLDGGFVRRLTPTECETLQGFPRGWTDVPYRGAPASDAARFKGLGNSWATNCAEWILRRLVSSEAFNK